MAPRSSTRCAMSSALPDGQLEALRNFTRAVHETPAHPQKAALGRFRKAEYDNKTVHDLLVVNTQKILSKFTNQLFHTSADAPSKSSHGKPPQNNKPTLEIRIQLRCSGRSTAAARPYIKKSIRP